MKIHVLDFFFNKKANIMRIHKTIEFEKQRVM